MTDNIERKGLVSLMSLFYAQIASRSPSSGCTNFLSIGNTKLF